MILYRLADAPHEVLPPPTFPRVKRVSVTSTTGESLLSLSSDSRYPGGLLSAERGLVAYAYDPTPDEQDMVDEEDVLHDPKGKIIKQPVSWRGFKNLAMLLLLLTGLLSLFVVYPVLRIFRMNDREALIVGNTRINSTGQAVSVTFDPRSQIPIP